MLDIKWIRENPKKFTESLKRRGLKVDIDGLIKIYNEYTSVLTNLQNIQMERNKASKTIGMKKSKGEDSKDIYKKVTQFKNELSSLQIKSDELFAEMNKILEEIPNLPEESVPDGFSAKENVTIRDFREIKKFSFDPKSHDILGINLKMMDFEQASHMSGSRFVILKGSLAKLERALSQFMIDFHTTNNSYLEVNPPSLVNDVAMFGTGQLPKFSDDLFKTTSGHWLIPTAEVPLTNMFAEEILNMQELPVRMTALTSCFRSEAGSAGKDTKGMIRLHEFKKVELVSLTRKDESEKELLRMLGCAEKVLQQLNLPYRVVELCCGDLGFSAKKTFDLEVWIPSQSKYREISSCSNCGDFQSRRMNTRFRNDTTKNIEYIHTLNGSGVAVGRALLAIMENYQGKDGSISIPDVLMPYMGGMSKIMNVK
ncbi:MAG: Serine--tRNA ligase [Alphaproteobacteria bacterium MarineAlpha9_Bin2]|nr:MAG: Serine--tRNA ligase [Alphaproteobacteria bacterium MarineAlpha9_Bin2]